MGLTHDAVKKYFPESFITAKLHIKKENIKSTKHTHTGEKDDLYILQEKFPQKTTTKIKLTIEVDEIQN